MKKILFVSLLTLSAAASAQQKLTLRECMQMGIENNLGLKTSRNEMRKSRDNLGENRAKLLPQITLVASFNDNFNPPVSVTDGSAYGKPYNVTKTLQYNASAGLQLQMPLYSQMALTAMDITRTVNDINVLSYEKARQDLMMQIAKVYYLLQNTKEQLSVVQQNIKRFETLKGITQAFYDNQMALEVDVKRISVQLQSTRIQAANAKAMLVEQFNMLKYILDYPADKDIDIVDMKVEEMEVAQMSGLDTQLYELQLLEQKIKLTDQQTALVKHGYLPTLALTGSWTYTAFSDKARHWFHNHEANKWYNANGLGIALRMPIFDGLEKRAKLRKARVDAETARISYQDALRGMKTQYANAVKDVLNNQRNYETQRQTYLLAEDVYEVTYSRYREGIASMTDVLTDQMNMSQAQNAYLTAHYNYQVANLQLMKLTGRIDSLAE